MSVTDRALTGGKTVPSQRKGDPVGGDDAPAQGGKKKKKLIGAVVLLVVLLAAGGGGAFMFLGGAPAAEEVAAEEVEVEKKPGPVLPLEAITINLADGRYLQVGIALQEAYPEEGAYGETDGSKALDILIKHLSGRPMGDLASTEQREAVKAEIVQAIDEAYKHKVYDIYFTTFVMQ